MEEKKILRKSLQQKLQDLTRPTYEHLSYIIAERLFAQPAWRNSKTIALTISRMPEVDTFQIIRKAWEKNKQVVIPKCFPHDRTMTFRKLTAFNELESVYYGLLEPIEDLTEEIHKGDIDLIIVPGLAFNREGYRLGFGGGYYDRYLKDYTGEKMALAFSSQIVGELPIEKHDIPVNTIVTNEETIKIYE